nr:HlyD family secretion protein [Endozoicomonas sp.]
MDNTTPHPIRRWFIIVVVLLLLSTGGYFYLEYQKHYPSTNDAYVHGNIIYIAPQVSGRVSVVNVDHYESVQEGEMLFQIDPAIYQAQLDRARAAYGLATKENEAASEGILAASSDISSAAANLRRVQVNYRRTMTLVSEGVLPEQDGDNARAALTTAQNDLASAQAHMAQLEAEQGMEGTEAPSVQEAAAALMLATLNLSYTNISAPIEGELGRISVHPGSIVNVGQALTPLVVSRSFWIQANFKEDDLGRIQPGMSASVQLDMYPGKTFSGVVAAISPASGSAFSLLPPENATGNWVKISQRFPVSIRLLDHDDQKGTSPLRVGSSATVT